MKRTAEGEARPTLVAIRNDGDSKAYELETETDELDFLLGRFPTSWREKGRDEDVSKLPLHHVKSRKKKGTDEEIVSVPATLDGLHAGDTVGMILGGSGDRFAAALSRRAEEFGSGTRVMRVPPFVFKDRRPTDLKDEDHIVLVELVERSSDLFYELGPRDRAFIRVKEALAARKEAQLARMGCAQRLRQRFIGSIFLSEEGRYPEGDLEDEYDRLKASDPILTKLLEEEKTREKELRKLLIQLDVWTYVLEPVRGCGEVLAAGIIVPIGDIRRFKSDAKLKAFCGVHVLSDGRFARKRRGEVSNWSPAARQALYLLGDQFNRNPDSVWGRKLREYKAKLRAKHPVPVEVPRSGSGNGHAEEVSSPDTPAKNGKKVKKAATVKRYTDGHIHKMAIWRTLTKFVEWLYKEWKAVEARHNLEPAPTATA